MCLCVRVLVKEERTRRMWFVVRGRDFVVVVVVCCLFSVSRLVVSLIVQAVKPSAVTTTLGENHFGPAAPTLLDSVP